MPTRRRFAAFSVSAALLCLAVVGREGARVFAQSGTEKGEWRFYGGDAGHTKYSPLDQINRDNVKNLQVVWRWKAENFGSLPDFNLEATPLMVKGVLYTTAGFSRSVVAINSATGETLWMYRLDEGSRGAAAPIRPAAGRGVGYWTDGKEERILHVTKGYRLIALDAKTGRPVPTFGANGQVDLFQELDRAQPPGEGVIGWNSPPIVVKDTVVVGAAFGGNNAVPPVVGHIRGYDVRTGKRRWIFHTVPMRGEFGSDSWENGSVEYAGNVGAWAPISADESLGYVYVPVEGALSDQTGQHRPGANLFAESLVCLDARTGRRVWHFQLTHHGLWDYDPPTAPILLDITRGDRRIKAVAQVTKQSFTYVFDRVTGEPVWPIEERPVPQSDVPGEKTSPTQPFPTKPAPFDRQGVTLDDALDLTPALKAEAVKALSQYKLGPLYSPPSLLVADGTKGTLAMPGLRGGANWSGSAVDPETGVLYVASISHPSVLGMVPCDPDHTPIPTMKYCGRGGFPEVQGLPPIKPPWGRITAIDLNSGEHLWMVPNSDTPEFVKRHPALQGVALPRTGSQDRSGVMVTRTLVFAGEGGGVSAAGPHSGGRILRALDKRTGETVSEFTLPGNQTGVPMTYMADGRQFIVVAVGGRNHPGELVALALPAR